MPYNNENPTPLYIETGPVLTPQIISGKRYSFEHIHLSGIPVVSYPDDFDPDKEEDILKFFPKNADSMICFQKISNVIKKFTEKNYNYEVFVDMDEAGQKDSGFITPTGTLVPQIIYPWDFGRNELKLDATDDDFSTASKEKYYCWSPVKPKTKDDSSEELKKAVNTLKNYGVKYDVANTMTADYISILGKNPYMDKDSFTRSYISNFNPTGAFALLLDFTGWEDDETGKNPSYASFKFDNSDSGNLLNSTDCDYVEFKAKPTGEITVSINRDNSASGPLNFSQMGQKILHVNSSDLQNKNVIFFYSLMNSLVVTGDLVTDPKQTSKNLICRKNKDLDILNETEPALNRFPAEHKKGGANNIRLSSQNVYVNFGNRVQATFNNCIGNFALAALRFCPVVSFSYFFKMSGEQTNTNTTENAGMEDYYCLEVGGKNFGYSGLSSQYRSKKVYYDAETQTSIFRVDFKFRASDTELQLNAFELFGIIHVTKYTGALTDVLNDDGNFSEDFQTNANSRLPEYKGEESTEDDDTEWTKFITSLNISHGLDGTTGSLILDKYLMMDIGENPKQAIGALTLMARNGFYDLNPIEAVPNENYSCPVGQIFKGYAMEIQDQVSEGGSQLSVKLVGIQKKLSDMKLVNCPFWDGDQVFENGTDGVLNYMISYSGCNLKYVPAFSEGAGMVSNIILPRSWDWQTPSTNFVLGTPVLEALNEIAKKINHQFVIQPDGCGYFYYMDEYGCPTWVRNGPIVRTYKESDIISMDIAPYLENKYNTFLTLGLLVKNDTEANQLVPDGEKPGMKFTQTNVGMGDYPWSRIITTSEPGLVTIKDLEKFHQTNVRFGQSVIFTGSITVPGWYGFFLFDKIMVESTVFYITGINHTINLQQKEWITSLSVAQFNPGDDS